MSGVVLLQPAPWKLEEAYNNVFTPPALDFLQRMCRQFDGEVEKLHTARLVRSAAARAGRLPQFRRSRERSDKTWRIAPLPPRLVCRRIDLGDVSASNTAHLVEALGSSVQGVQVEFDDGHCPTWRNQVHAHHNIILAARGELAGELAACPLLMLRPRAWNMLEHNILVDGKEAPGPLVDFALMMHHVGRRLYECGCGPYLYLSKLESAEEARLWNDIFVWTQRELDIPQGTMKACVLIEHINASFELEEILFALRQHSLGFNCGIWDYAASVVASFGWRREFMLPDRNKYVNMSRHLLASYLRLVVRTCHARGAPATGGMAALLLPQPYRQRDKQSASVISAVLQAKLSELEVGVDGFLVYDARLVPHLNELWAKYSAAPNQISRVLPPAPTVTAEDLLTVPSGGVTVEGVRHNIAISILFVYHWLSGVGHFFYNGSVEDSATAEISRWQIWQWIRFEPPLEDSPEQRVTFTLVETECGSLAARAHRDLCRSAAERKRLTAARYMALELFCLRTPPQYITTYLNDNHKFRTLHNKALVTAKSSL